MTRTFKDFNLVCNRKTVYLGLYIFIFYNFDKQMNIVPDLDPDVVNKLTN